MTALDIPNAVLGAIIAIAFSAAWTLWKRWKSRYVQFTGQHGVGLDKGAAWVTIDEPLENQLVLGNTRLIG